MGEWMQRAKDVILYPLGNKCSESLMPNTVLQHSSHNLNLAILTRWTLCSSSVDNWKVSQLMNQRRLTTLVLDIQL